MIAYLSQAKLKLEVLDLVKDLDLVKGQYWDGTKGCAVGCLTKDPKGGHSEFSMRWGIPEEVARLYDSAAWRVLRDKFVFLLSEAPVPLTT